MSWASQAEIEQNFVDRTPNCTVCGTNPCCFQCPNSPHFYSAEQEREDSLYNDSLSHDAWFALAVHQYELVHGEPYVS